MNPDKVERGQKQKERERIRLKARDDKRDTRAVYRDEEHINAINSRCGKDFNLDLSTKTESAKTKSQSLVDKVPQDSQKSQKSSDISDCSKTRPIYIEDVAKNSENAHGSTSTKYPTGKLQKHVDAFQNLLNSEKSVSVGISSLVKENLGVTMKT